MIRRFWRRCLDSPRWVLEKTSLATELVRDTGGPQSVIFPFVDLLRASVEFLPGIRQYRALCCCKLRRVHPLGFVACGGLGRRLSFGLAEPDVGGQTGVTPGGLWVFSFHGLGRLAGDISLVFWVRVGCCRLAREFRTQLVFLMACFA